MVEDKALLDEDGESISEEGRGEATLHHEVAKVEASMSG